MSPSVDVVGDKGRAAKTPETAGPETTARRVKRLQAEARRLAKDHVRALAAAILKAETLAAEIAAGGEAYPPSVRELARRFAEDAEAKVQTLEAMAART